MRTRIPVAMAGLLCLALGGLAAPAAFAAETVTVYVSPDGDSDNDGSSPDQAVPSLNDAQRVLADGPEADATVLVRGGTYYQPEEVRWKYAPEDTMVTIKPEPDSGTPVFTGRTDADDTTGADSYWMIDSAPRTRLALAGLTVRDYTVGGVFLRGDNDDDQVTDTTVTGMTFTHLGTKYGDGDNGYATVHLNRASGSTITGNHLVDLENTTHGGNMHGVYLALHSSHNTVRDNEFDTISGDAVRSSNRSDDNLVDDNTFTRTGIDAMFSDWRFDRDEGFDECSSDSVFSNNTYGDGYSDDRLPAIDWDDKEPACDEPPITDGGGNVYDPDEDDVHAAGGFGDPVVAQDAADRYVGAGQPLA